MALSLLCLALLMSFFLPFTNGSGFETISKLISRARRQNDPSLKGNGNGLIDESMVYWKEWLKENGYDPVHIDSFDQTLDPFLLKLRDCTIAGLTTFKRTGDVTLNASEAFFVAVANVGVDEVTLDCKVEIRWSIVRARGNVFAKLNDYSVEGTIVQIRPPPRMTALRITNEGILELKFSGTGLLGTLVEWLAEGFVKSKLQSLLGDSDKIMDIANEVLRGIDVDRIVNVV